MGVQSAIARSFRMERADLPLTVDPRTVDAVELGGAPIVPLSELDPREVHRVYEATASDVPFRATFESPPFESGWT